MAAPLPPNLGAKAEMYVQTTNAKIRWLKIGLAIAAVVAGYAWFRKRR